MSRFSKRWFHRFNRIFEPQEYDCNDKTYFCCLEETNPYLRKPFARKILYLKTLNHKNAQICVYYLLTTWCPLPLGAGDALTDVKVSIVGFVASKQKSALPPLWGGCAGAHHIPTRKAHREWPSRMGSEEGSDLVCLFLLAWLLVLGYFGALIH